MAVRRSIRDVALKSGLSTATISRVFNGTGKVSEKTRTLVLETCQKLNYVPNAAARALSTNRSRTIVAIIPTIDHSVFAKYIGAIEAALGERGYSLVLSISDPASEPPLETVRKLSGLGADAFILSGADHAPELLDFFNTRNIPFVFSSVWNPSSETPTIGYDNFNLAKQAVEYLVNHGHSDIAVLHGPSTHNDRTQQRMAGAGSVSHRGVTVEFFEDEISVAGGKRAARQILNEETSVTAVLCFSDVLALGTYFCAQELGLSIPNDISVMGFENLDWASSATPALTTTNLPARRMGMEVAQQLIDHLENGTLLAATKIEGEIVERASVTRRRPQD